MRTNWFPLSPIRRSAIATGIFCLAASPGAFSQQFMVQRTPLPAGCVAAQLGGSSQGKAVCDHQAIVELARSGHAFAENQLGMESALVVSPTKTIREARKWFERAAQKGYVPAQVNLAVLYLNGWGVERNYGTALYWLKAAADQGNARAHTNLGIL
jgi:uncharacterized protein